jgi:hypothetical protein
MQVPNKSRKKRGKLYFSSTKALKTIRMGRKKVPIEKYETGGINIVLDFEDTWENATLSTVDESEGSSTSRRRGSQLQGPSKMWGRSPIPHPFPHFQHPISFGFFVDFVLSLNFLPR